VRRGSFMHTQEQMRAGAAAATASPTMESRVGKDVTRRLGWRWAQPGMFVLAVSKCQGLKPGEIADTFGAIRIVSVSREPLNAITEADVVREGFADMSPMQFVSMFCRHMGAKPFDLVTRVEFAHCASARIDVRRYLTQAQSIALGVAA
jgi:hypothetical protein